MGSTAGVSGVADDVADRMQRQTAEFKAVDELSKSWDSLRQTAIVDDDYGAVRFVYEANLRALIIALKNNGRI